MMTCSQHQSGTILSSGLDGLDDELPITCLGEGLAPTMSKLDFELLQTAPSKMNAIGEIELNLRGLLLLR